MIIDRYTRPANFPEYPTSDPILQELDWILDDPVLFELVRRDFAKHYKPTRRGRRPIAVEVVLRMTVLRRRKKWSYRQTETEVRDNPTYRSWVRVYHARVPDYSTLNELERVIRPNTLRRINARIIALAQEYRLTRGYRLRVDSSVTESNIHYPTDSALLYDGVRLLSRWLKRARPLLPAHDPRARLCQSHTRSARRRMQRIVRWSQASPARRRTPPHGGVKEKAVSRAYAELLAIARTTVAQSRVVMQALPDAAMAAAPRLQQQFAAVLPLVEQVIAQTERRVRNGESVPAADKVVSLIEPHTQIICRGKAPPHATEFGHKVNYAEVEGGLIIAWQVIATGNPPDADWLVPALREHRRLFHHAPKVLAGDRGFFSPDNKRQACQMGVKHFAIPRKGRLTPQQRRCEKRRWFKQGQRFRNGIEGRISVVRRTVQLRRCPHHGLDGFERWIGWGIIVANLVVMARKLHNRRRGSKHQAK